MSLIIWMPLNGNLNNQGVSKVTYTGGTASYNTGCFTSKGVSIASRTNFYCSKLNGINVFSITFWANVTSCITDWADVLGFDTLTSTGAAGAPFRFEATPSTRACSFHNNATFTITTASNILITNNQKGEWHHCGFTCDGVKVYTYIDGKLTNTNDAYSPLGHLSGYFHIGDSGIAGTVNDFRVYDNCISTKEVKEISKGLFAHYPLSNFIKSDLSTSTEYDTSGFGNDMTRTNITFNTDSPRFGSCSVFNGSSSYLKTSGNIFPQQMKNLTISVWAYMTSWANFTGNIFSCTENGGFNAEKGTNVINFPMNVYTVSDLSTYTYISNTFAYSSLTNGWHLFTITYNTSALKLYIDGELKATKTSKSYGMHVNTDVPLFIGCEAAKTSDGAPYFNGRVSDFRLYGTTLTDAEVKELYNSPIHITNNGSLMTAGEVVES